MLLLCCLELSKPDVMKDSFYWIVLTIATGAVLEDGGCCIGVKASLFMEGLRNVGSSNFELERAVFLELSPLGPLFLFPSNAAFMALFSLTYIYLALIPA